MTDHAPVGKARRVMLVGLAVLASVAPAAAQSKGYRPPPPPPPPMPRPSAPVAPPPRTTSLPPSRSQGLTPSGPSSSQVPKPSAPGSTPKGGTTQKPPDYAKLSPSELQKAIGSHTKQIDSYRAKVNNPRANQPNWSSLNREQQGALMRQWNDEIRRQEASRATAQRMLSQKTR